MSLDPKVSTLEDAQDWLRSRLETGAACPCCKQHAKIYKRKLNSGMAASLVAFARVTLQMSPPEGWLKVPDDFVNTSTVLKVLKNREYNKLRYWSLLEPHAPDQFGDTPYTGKWRITEMGLQFARGEIEIPESVFIYDNRRLRVSEERTTIQQALGTKFNYAELMGKSV